MHGNQHKFSEEEAVYSIRLPCLHELGLPMKFIVSQWNEGRIEMMVKVFLIGFPS